jgi:hypothetical protein
MMATVRLQSLSGPWDPCGARVFFSGMEYNPQMEQTALRRRSIEIDRMLETKIMHIPVTVQSPSDVEAFFLKDLAALAEETKDKLQLVSLNDKFEPTEMKSLEWFLKTNGGETNDDIRSLYTEVAQCFVSKRPWQETHAQPAKAKAKARCKGRAKAKTHPQRHQQETPVIRSTLTEESPVAMEPGVRPVAMETEGAPLGAQPAEETPVVGSTSTGSSADESQEQAASAQSVGPITPVTQVVSLLDDVVTLNKLEVSPADETPEKLELPSGASTLNVVNRNVEEDNFCNVEGPCMLFFSCSQEDGGPEIYFVRLIGEGVKSKKFRNSDPLVILSHPGLSVSDEPVPDDGAGIPFSIDDSTKVLVDYGSLEKQKKQVELFSSVVLKLVDKHHLLVHLPGYILEVLPIGADACIEPPAKKTKKQRVNLAFATTQLHLAGDEKCLDLFEDLFHCSTADIHILWCFTARVNSTLCTLELSGIAVMPGSKGAELLNGKSLVIADGREATLRSSVFLA